MHKKAEKHLLFHFHYFFFKIRGGYLSEMAYVSGISNEDLWVLARNEFVLADARAHPDRKLDTIEAAFERATKTMYGRQKVAEALPSCASASSYNVLRSRVKSKQECATIEREIRRAREALAKRSGHALAEQQTLLDWLVQIDTPGWQLMSKQAWTRKVGQLKHTNKDRMRAERRLSLARGAKRTVAHELKVLSAVNTHMTDQRRQICVILKNIGAVKPSIMPLVLALTGVFWLGDDLNDKNMLSSIASTTAIRRYGDELAIADFVELGEKLSNRSLHIIADGSKRKGEEFFSRMAVFVDDDGAVVNRLLDIHPIVASDAASEAAAIKSTLDSLKIPSQNVSSITLDNCSTNMGAIGGMAVLFACLLGRTLVTIGCDLHILNIQLQTSIVVAFGKIEILTKNLHPIQTVFKNSYLLADNWAKWKSAMETWVSARLQNDTDGSFAKWLSDNPMPTKKFQRPIPTRWRTVMLANEQVLEFRGFLMSFAEYMANTSIQTSNLVDTWRLVALGLAHPVIFAEMVFLSEINSAFFEKEITWSQDGLKAHAMPMRVLKRGRLLQAFVSQPSR